MAEDEVTTEGYTIEDEINDLGVSRPHVVLLGAGASFAALPNGDKNGKKLPLMNNLIEILNLEPTIRKYGFSSELGNFEKFYAEISEDPKYQDLRNELEQQVYDYFYDLELPDHPTVYDHLILSLREKDVIATFNWDPLLCQAYERNHSRGFMPTLLFLHGNVFVGYCKDHPNAVGHPCVPCSKCGGELTKTKLLYPVAQKDYTSDPFISREWKAIRAALKEAFIFTIFGYGAPVSDVEAVELLKEAWISNKHREFFETEIIDIKSREELEETWADFYFSHHYLVSHDFYDSEIPNHPRRTCEAMWQRIGMANFIARNPIPKNDDFTAVNVWMEPLKNVERERRG